MNLLFICRTLEQGKCGVGDYVRKLSFDLVKKGCRISMLSYNDPYVSGKYDSVLTTEAGPIEILRIPEKTAPRAKTNMGKNWIDRIDPEFISLQYVPYSFQKKGLPFSLASRLYEIGAGRKWHIMFHELWIGMNSESSSKDRLIGYFQKKIVERLNDKLEPVSVSTNTRLYVQQLENMGIRAKLLPLCSNIPVFEEEIKNGKTLKFENKKIGFVLFGEIQKGAPVENFAKEVFEYAALNNRVPILMLLGRNGAEASHWIKTWQSMDMEVEVLGEGSERNISSNLTQGDFGITTTPLPQVDKSGTVIAMQNHDLPVICVARKWTPIGIENFEHNAEVLVYTQDKLKYVLENLSEITTPKSKVSELSNMFLSHLNTSGASRYQYSN